MKNKNSRRMALVMVTVAQLLGLGLTAAGVYWQNHYLESKARERFERHGDHIEVAIMRHFEQSIHGLLGARGLHAANGSLTRDSFRAYVASQELEHEFPSVLGFAFVERVPRPHLAQFMAAARAEGPGFTLRSSGAAADLYVIKYVEPTPPNLAVLGFDLGQQATLRESFERAVDSGQPALSGVQMLEHDGRQRPGFLLNVPVYRRGSDPVTVEQRREALAGVLTMALDLEALMSRISPVVGRTAAIELYDGVVGQASQPVYRSQSGLAPVPADSARFLSQRVLQIDGHVLTLHVRSTPDFEVDRGSLVVMGVAGVVVSTLLALLIWLLASSRQSALWRAVRMTLEHERLARALRFSPTAVVIMDRQQRVSWTNEAFLHLSGLQVDAVRSRTLGELLLAGQADPGLLRGLERAMATGQSWQAELRRSSQDGRGCWLDVRVVPLSDAAGRPDGFVAIVVDISDMMRTRLQLEAALRESNTLLGTLNRHAIVTVTDRAGILTEVNDAFCAISGYAREELLGRQHRIINSGFHDGAFWSAFWNAISSGSSWRGEICNRAQDGSLYWVDSMVLPLRGEDGRIDRFISIRFDITPRKRVELELAKALRNAEQASEAKSDFLANMSHEIRTPMNAVIGLTRLLLDTELSLYQRDYLQRIELSATDLLGVLNDVLDYSKIEAGHMQLEAIPLRVADVLEKTRLMFASQAETQGLRLDFALAADVPAVLQGDPLRLLQVIHNLVGNALKFTNQGSVQVSVACVEQTDAGVLLKVQVSDSGIGLTREQVDRLFVAFQQADSSTTRQHGGSGLGLSICKRLVELMGGEIGVDTAFGVGSSFWFTARLGRTQEAPVALLEKPQPPASIRGARVLVVDDNPTNLLVAQAYLEQLGLEVHNAISGPKAIAKVGQMAFDAILMDLQMPEMDGFEATRAIRAAGQQMPIIALSASAMVNDQQAAKAAGMDDHVSKPIDPAQLGAVLARWITPRVTAVAAADAEREVAGRASTPASTGLVRPRLLLVDDTRVNLEVLQAMLEDQYTLSVASSGQQALALLAREPAPDLILLDVMMPGMDGYQVQAALKQDRATRDIPVIFITASSDGESEAGALAAGAVDFLHKPIQREVLRSRVRLQLDLVRQRVQLEALNQRLGISLEEVRQAKQVMAQAHARELEISGIIQQQLLFGAPPDELKGFEVAYYSEASKVVDGDFYAFTQIGPDSFEVLTGDVMGKGMAAALVGAGVKNQYRKYFTELQTWGDHARPPSPAALVNAIHGDISARLVALDTFVTLTLLRFDRRSATVTWVNAGHTPTLLAAAHGGPVLELLGDNVPIGVLENEVYQEHVTPFGPGDLLMLYSDGLSEAQNPQRADYGNHRIVQLMQRMHEAGAAPALLLQALRDELRQFTDGAPASDDRTVVVVRAQAVGQSPAGAD